MSLIGGVAWVLLGTALGGLALWILRPLQSPQQRMGVADDAHWKELVDAKHAAYRSILDLEFDKAVGKVSEADYAILRRQQEGEALAVLSEMDAMAGTGQAPDGAPRGDAQSLGDTLEAEIAAARARLRPRP